MNFLIKEAKFRMEAPFIEGVHYLSRAEEAKARHLILEDQDRTNIQLAADDEEGLAFVARVRAEINLWKNRRTPGPEYLNIAPKGYDQPPYPDQGLNGFQKRLVHELIRAEYPDLASIARGGFVQIRAYDKQQEEIARKNRSQFLEEKLVRQVGLRWLVEAMAGGDLSPIDPKSFHLTPGPRQEAVALEFNNVRRRLEGSPTVLVGHNLFTDLINFYACFFGDLPEKVEDFQKCVHEIFPLVIDTKYLATHNVNSTIDRSSLTEVDEELSKLPFPAIGRYLFPHLKGLANKSSELHPEHLKYNHLKLPHDAGYDSFMTANVLIRQSAKLEKLGHYVDDNNNAIDEEEYYTPSESAVSPGEADTGISLDVNALPAHIHSKEARLRTSRSQNSSKSGHTTYAHDNYFGLLGEDVRDEDVYQRPVQPRRPSAQSRQILAERGKRMPAWDSDFWNVYGNKLRVNGTREGVCVVDAQAGIS